MADADKMSGGISRREWVSGFNRGLVSSASKTPFIQDVRKTIVGEHILENGEGNPPDIEYCTRGGALDYVNVASNLRNIHLVPELLARYTKPEWSPTTIEYNDWLNSAGVPDMDKDADKLADLDRRFNEPDGLLATLRSNPDDQHAWGLTVFGIKRAWEGLQKFCSKNRSKHVAFANLGNAFDALKDRLASSRDPKVNPLIKGADSLASLITKMAEAGLTDHNGERIKAPKWD